MSGNRRIGVAAGGETRLSFLDQGATLHNVDFFAEEFQRPVAIAGFDAERRCAFRGVAHAVRRDQGLRRMLVHLAGPEAARRLQTLGRRLHVREAMGFCMVPPEGACAAQWSYGRCHQGGQAGASAA